MASISSHIDLKKHASDFWHMSLLLFYKVIKFDKKKIELPLKKRHNFLMTGIIRIHRHCFVREHSDNILSEFQPFGPGAAVLELKCTYNSPISYFRETQKK